MSKKTALNHWISISPSAKSGKEPKEKPSCAA
jgi:hypothetical protein